VVGFLDITGNSEKWVSGKFLGRLMNPWVVGMGGLTPAGTSI
jgi:hypothetical protein